MCGQLKPSQPLLFSDSSASHSFSQAAIVLPVHVPTLSFASQSVEFSCHHVSVGHHASERIGPRCLARWINDNLDVEAEFVDIPNPV